VQVYDVATSLAEHPVDPVSTADQVRVYVPVPVPPDAPVVTTENDSVAPTVAWFVEIVPADSAEFTVTVSPLFNGVTGPPPSLSVSESDTTTDPVCEFCNVEQVYVAVDSVMGQPDPAGTVAVHA
jgi:hypothetical protein